jgi:hypothetical protein
MEKEYDLFERLPDGSVLWRTSVPGLGNASLKLQEIAKSTPHECFAAELPSGKVVARLNARPSGERGMKFTVFQIAYDEKLAPVRADLLKRRGYNVTTVFGNESAKTALRLPQRCDLFMVGHRAPEESRKAMVAWLKARYPGVPIIALNRPEVSELTGADYNVKLNGPDAWLSIISTALT